MSKLTFIFITLYLIFIPMKSFAQQSISYVALGDSYTIGTGAQPHQSWPAVMTKQLQKDGINIELVANLGVNGWTTQDVIRGELPVFEKIKPEVATLLIGTNDWVQGMDRKTFQANLHEILTRVLKILPSKSILIVTIPDFSTTPVGHEYSNGRDIAQGLAEFNQIIIEEAKLFGLKTVDLFEISKEMAQDSSMISEDGLHPSAKGYARWTEIIEPEFKKLLK